jgi:hypothetical protein
MCFVWRMVQTGDKMVYLMLLLLIIYGLGGRRMEIRLWSIGGMILRAESHRTRKKISSSGQTGFFSKYFGFVLSLSLHQCSLSLFHLSAADTI